jgi:hypothetical protein
MSTKATKPKKPTIPSNNGKTLVERDEKGRVLPGSVLNPEGPKPGYKHMSTILAEALKELASGSDTKSWAEMVVKRLIMNAVSGKEKSIEMIFERMDGKVTDKLQADISGVLAHGDASDPKLAGVVDDFISNFKKKLHEQNKELGD